MERNAHVAFSYTQPHPTFLKNHNNVNSSRRTIWGSRSPFSPLSPHFPWLWRKTEAHPTHENAEDYSPWVTPSNKGLAEAAPSRVRALILSMLTSSSPSGLLAGTFLCPPWERGQALKLLKTPQGRLLHWTAAPSDPLLQTPEGPVQCQEAAGLPDQGKGACSQAGLPGNYVQAQIPVEMPCVTAKMAAPLQIRCWSSGTTIEATLRWSSGRTNPAALTPGGWGCPEPTLLRLTTSFKGRQVAPRSLSEQLTPHHSSGGGHVPCVSRG